MHMTRMMTTGTNERGLMYHGSRSALVGENGVTAYFWLIVAHQESMMRRAGGRARPCGEVSARHPQRYPPASFGRG